MSKIKKFWKYVGYSLASITALFLLVILSMCSVYIYFHHEQEIYTIENKGYEISLYYFPSGFGTLPYIKVYCEDDKFGKREIFFYDGKDTADLKFIDSSIIQIDLIEQSYYSGADSNVYYWYVTQSFKFDLSQEITPYSYKAE